MAKSSPVKAEADSAVYVSLAHLVALEHKARGFSYLPKQPVHSILSGRHSSRLRGRGLNFEELRHYRPGDDIRTLDWKVTNRTKSPHVRVYTEERERTVLLVVDQRQSMFFGSQVKMKSVAAAETAALSAWRVLSVGDRVGGLVFGDNEIKEIRPQRSRNTVMQLFHHIVEKNHAIGVGKRPDNNQQQLNRALQEAERLCGHDCLIVLISDLDGWCDETVKRLRRLSQHNDVIAPLIFDPLEQHLPDAKQFVVSDGDMQIAVDGSGGQIKSDYTQGFVSNVEFLQHELQRYGIPVLPINTVDPVLDQLRAAVGAKLQAGRS
ncbi:MAG: DUF58 domain-containing protein [Pseudomonadales bacterium]